MIFADESDVGRPHGVGIARQLETGLGCQHATQIVRLHVVGEPVGQFGRDVSVSIACRLPNDQDSLDQLEALSRHPQPLQLICRQSTRWDHGIKIGFAAPHGEQGSFEPVNGSSLHQIAALLGRGKAQNAVGLPEGKGTQSRHGASSRRRHTLRHILQ